MLKSVNICRGVRSLIILTLFYCGLIFPGLAAEARAGSDFNGDGRDDVVVGVPGEDVGSIKDAGAVQILYGGVGRTPSFDQVWHLNRPDVPLECGAGDRFGSATATGDFDNDGYDDLAVGIPFKNNAMGQVLVLYGGAGGLSAAGAQAWDQNQLQDKAERGDRFGAALVVGDFDANGYDDLAVGVPGEDFADEAQKCADGVCTDAGVVNLIYGGPSGLAAAGNELWHQDRGEDWDGWVEWGDCFGASLAAGDFDNNRADDLAVGALCEHTGGSDVRGRNHGAVSVYYGAAGVGLTGDGTQYLRQWADRVAGDPQADDAFGYALAAGDLNGDGYDDLIVGVPGEEADTGQARDAGAVQVFYGQAGTGLGPSNTERNELLSREALGLGRATAGMQWGKALAAGNFNRDRFVDVAVGAPLDDVGSAEQGGSVSVLFGSATGFLRSGNQLLTQDTPSVSGTANSGDWFGYTLTAGDLDDDGVDDLAVGVPFENIGEAVDAGAVNLFYGAAGVGLAAADNLWLHQGAAGLSETAEAGDQFGGRWVPELIRDPWPREPDVDGGLEEQTGALRVTIDPAAARSAGARWQVDDGPWRNSGEASDGLSVGEHPVAFNNLADWNAPARATATIVAGVTTELAVTYLPISTGAVTVTIQPPEAVLAGAAWRIDGGDWLDGGQTRSGLAAGDYTVAFRPLSDWPAPGDQTVTIAAGQVETIVATYAQQPGTLQVTITPDAAISAGAQWRFDGGAWLSSGQIASDLDTGSHTVAFKTVPGWAAPAARTVTIQMGQHQTATGRYTAAADEGGNGGGGCFIEAMLVDGAWP